MSDAFLDALASEDQRAGATYFSPTHLVNWQKHWYGTPYWQSPAGLPIGEMDIVTYSAPHGHYGIAAAATGAIQTAVLGSGQAPTAGIYTGITGSTGGATYTGVEGSC